MGACCRETRLTDGAWRGHDTLDWQRNSTMLLCAAESRRRTPAGPRGQPERALTSLGLSCASKMLGRGCEVQAE